LNDGSFLKDFESNNPSTQYKYTLYYHVSKKGEILAGEVLALRKPYVYQTGMKLTSKGFAILPFTLPFNRSSLISISNNDLIYTAWTNHFLVKIYDSNGNYKRAFYYPYHNSPILNFHIDRNLKQFLTKENTPATWPALLTIFFDDQNRLWVFTSQTAKLTLKVGC
jgi:hypothetical protein